MRGIFESESEMVLRDTRERERPSTRAFSWELEAVVFQSSSTYVCNKLESLGSPSYLCMGPLDIHEETSLAPGLRVLVVLVALYTVQVFSGSQDSASESGWELRRLGGCQWA